MTRAAARRFLLTLADLGLMLAFWGPRPVDPPGFAFVQAVTRAPGVVTRETLAAR